MASLHASRSTLHAPHFTLHVPHSTLHVLLPSGRLGGGFYAPRSSLPLGGVGGGLGASYGTSTLLIILLMISSCVTLVASAS